jgi:bifunctional lysine-specific demethylase and histidyl-hydroxylase NO66
MPDPASRVADGALARLVGDTAAFLARDLGVRAVHRPRADPGGFADLLDLDAVDAIVTGSGLRTPAFRLVRQGTTLPVERVTRRARIGSRPVDDLVDVGAVQREFAAGATIVLQGLQRSWHPIATLCRELEATLTHPVQANAYLTPPVAQGLHLHADPHDVLVLQTHGEKRWVVHPGENEPTWDLTLRPGDVLYLPAGTRHAAQTTEQPSLHLTIGIRTTTWRELVERAVAQAVDGLVATEPALAGPLPAGWASEPASLDVGLRRRLVALARELEDTEAVRTTAARAADAFWTSRTPDGTGGLRDVLEVEHLDDATRLRIRAGASCRFHEERGDAGAQLIVRLADRRLRMPTSLAPAMHAIVAAGRFAPADLAAQLDLPSRLVLCRRLVREGLLTIDRQPGTGG